MTHDVEVIFVVDTFPITANGPDGPIAENRPLLAQTARAIRLQLISNRLAGIPGRRYDGMNMIRTSADCPQVPAPVIAMSPTLPFGDRALLRRQQQDVVFQSFPSPLSQSRLRLLVAFTSPSPAALVALKVTAVYSPGNEERNRFVRVHRNCPSAATR
ncbi:MAG: hypothetical protein IIA67_07760 [Planctomycetes bacterium]|nr:hypothetical protein [Planctomycetota bacterium]